ncbi:uncharacterized protein FOMMEDRAFT_157073 [Fomitiporia mediterranea MF3/22]|uniref:uncharacterized protein n=1 Tax=Fomitiporia mediterranea (strain MF3/22) TaxID=694068 RepID=UPI000440967C|nr:uncharacterized protein FOMMEDRAFT_157073 [Fomitiporia mediterranea MF3/22]EJD01932.1 hypothetical protein FOMMEDRAFT_157073 [Fomitiporia mediterranea MF3/22]
MLSTSVEQYSCSFTWWPARSSAAASSSLASSAIGIRSCPRGGQGVSDEEGNRHAAVDIEQEDSVPKIEQAASAQQHSSATQSMRHTSTAAPAQRVAKTLRTQLALRKVTERLRSCYQRPREKIESAWRTELREKIARGIEKRDDGNRLADGEGQGDARTVIGVSLDLAVTHGASLWTWTM